MAKSKRDKLIEQLQIQRELKIRKARKSLWAYNCVLSPDFYKSERWHLWVLSWTLQYLYERKLNKENFRKICTNRLVPEWFKDTVDWDSIDDNRVYTKLMINMPPRFGKSRTLVNFCDWILGQSLKNRIITVSYNTDLAASMSRYVRDGIMMEKVDPMEIVFSDIFPTTKVAKGNSGFMKWALEGSFFNYLGTGLEGTITGVGANCLAGDTLVATDKGEVTIKDIFGNGSKYKVLSYNEEERRLEFKRIIATRKTYNRPVVKMLFEVDEIEGCVESIVCTKDHKFFVKKKNSPDFQWIEARKICQNDCIMNSNLEVYRLSSIHDVEKCDVYDLQIEDNHNFFACTLLTHNCTIVDDPVKNAQEAYNANVLDGIWDWYTGTFLSRSEDEGDGSIDIINHTRWSTQDLCGRILDNPDMGYKWLTLSMPAEYESELLCPTLLSREKYNELKGAMDNNIFQANYLQKPLDVEGRLFKDFKTYDKVPEGIEKIIAYCDTADEGSDYLACIIGGVKDGEGYIFDIIFTQENMQVTEPLTARKLFENHVNSAKIESNNGGKGFARNVERLLWENHKTRQINIEWFHQTENKMARILTGATFVENHVYFPKGWERKWQDFYVALTTFTKDGKNKHDDGVEALVEWGKMITGDGSINSYIEWMKRMKEGKG